MPWLRSSVLLIGGNLLVAQFYGAEAISHVATLIGGCTSGGRGSFSYNVVCVASGGVVWVCPDSYATPLVLFILAGRFRRVQYLWIG